MALYVQGGRQMANFFKNYGVNAYQKKHQGEVIENINTVRLAGCSAPDPKTLRNKKQSERNRALYGSVSEDENNN